MGGEEQSPCWYIYNILASFKTPRLIGTVEVPKPALLEDRDVVIKVTGSTVCGSDVHIMHGVVVQVEKGDILGHEFCGIVESVGPGVKTLKPGDRVVNSFVVSCGECRFCKQNLTTACDKTNSSTTHTALYGDRMGGIFGYSHFTGGYAGGQAEYVRVPIADQNLLKLGDNVPFEKGMFFLRWASMRTQYPQVSISRMFFLRLITACATLVSMKETLLRFGVWAP